MIVVLFMILLAVAVLAPWLGADTSDSRSETAHPTAGWYPPLPTR
jgi:flagellar basal body-associated protein FliL